jgi:hypothetical protein
MEKSTIKKKFIEYILENGEKPKSVFSFSKSLKISESEFYNIYPSFEAIESDFWLGSFTEIIYKLEKDDTYIKYSAKEKLLALYFMWISKLKENRSYVFSFRNEFTKSVNPADKSFEKLKESFLNYSDSILSEGILNKEVAERKYISDKYKYGLWIQTIFILNYWINDSSDNFEMTDAAIEKSVNLAFKLISDNALDSMIDFGKFIFQK